MTGIDVPVRGLRAARLATMLSVLAVFGCGHQHAPPRRPELTIQLRWIKGYPAETRRNVETGMDWALSFLGATLPSATPDVYSWNGNVVTLDLDEAGLSPQATPAWISLLANLKASDEYRRTGALDIGRFVMLTLCSSPQYFALTGAPLTFADFQARHPQERKPAAVVQSGIAKGNRLVEIGPPGPVADIFFVAFEGTGSIADGSFHKAEVETLDFMPNGQLRFGLYDLAGHQKPGTTPELTDAGKPSKCLWCHEIGLQQPYKNVTDVPGYYSTAEFRNIVRERMSAVRLYRADLKSRVDFSRTNDHTYAELLYLSFAEPSAARLALEWNEPEAKIKEMLAGCRTHAQQERPVLGNQLYDRVDIDRFAPYQTIRVPSQLREAGGYDPDLTKQDAAGASGADDATPRPARGP